MARNRAAQVPQNRCPSAPESVPKCPGIGAQVPGTGAQVRPESVPKSGRNRCPSQSGKRNIGSRRLGALDAMAHCQVVRFATPTSDKARYVDIPAREIVAWW